MSRYYIMIVLLTVSVLGEAQNRHFFAPCSDLPNYDPFWLNTTTQSTKILGNGYIAYPNLPNGKPYLNTWQSIEWQGIAEMSHIRSLSNPSIFKCPAQLLTMESAELLTLKAMKYENALCELQEGTRMLAEGVQEKFVEAMVTDSSQPDLKVTITFSLVNASYSIPVPASSTTYMHSYSLNYSANVPKINFKIENWNWTITDTVNSSLRLFFYGSTMADEDTEVVYSEAGSYPFTKFITNTSNTYFESSFIRGFEAQGVQYLTDDRSDTINPYPVQANSPVTVPFSMGLCHGFQPPPVLYNILNYDPSIIALWGGPDIPEDSNPAVPPTNKNKNRLNPAAYAVPIAAATIGLAAAAVVIFFVLPKRQETMKTVSKQGTRETAPKKFDEALTPASAPAEQVNAASSEPAPKSTWARSARPEL